MSRVQVDNAGTDFLQSSVLNRTLVVVAIGWATADMQRTEPIADFLVIFGGEAL